MEYYPKIDTLYNRNEFFKVRTDSLRREEFGLINRWVIETKLDGMNMSIAIAYFEDEYRFFLRGRTDKSQIPAEMRQWFNGWQYKNEGSAIHWMKQHDLFNAEIFFEGVGSKINGGGEYGIHHGIVFDVKVNTESWLDPYQVSDVAHALNLERAFMLPGNTDIHSLTELVRNGVGDRHRHTMAEGVVAKPPVPLYDRRGKRVMFKLKTKDF